MRMKVLSLAVLAAVALMGAGCKKPAAPADALQNMKEAMVDVQQVSFEFATAGYTVAGQPGSVQARMTGHLQRGDQQVANGAGTFSLNMSGEQPMDAAGEYRMVNGVNYLRLTKAPVMPGFDLKQFEGQWFSFPSSAADFMEKPEEKILTERQISDLEALFRDSDFFASSSEAGAETLRGEATTIYEVTLDEEEIVRMAREAARITEEAFTAQDEEGVREMVGKWNTKPGRLWIGNDNSYLYRVLMHAPSDEGSEGMVQLDLFNHNQSVPAVEAPADAKDFGSLLGGMFGGGMMFMGTPQPIPDAGAMTPPVGMYGSVPGMTPEMMQQYQEMQKLYMPQ